ncbi:hypothetical protein BCR39DRAFT_537919 [Naematelia encephala]|uniref:Cohesin loading factor-domain-containing protein n=1 Tax=Naematelia encephala TaxID=71784 RepID=A0A1Y2B0T0_9TREE|nr:hypothetical protein BCR39DRAFT_537919 [Naematelia encephala]
MSSPAGTGRRLVNLVGTKHQLDLVEQTANGPQAKRVRKSAPVGEAHLPLLPSLYHLAIAAKNASSTHLQQVFIPPEVSSAQGTAFPLVSRSGIPYEPDPAAASKALGLQLLALDLLKLGMASKDITDRERVAFSIEIGLVSEKVLAEKRKEVDRVRLAQEAEEMVGAALGIARQHAYLKAAKQELEVVNARLAFLQSKEHVGQRLVRQALKDANEPTHRYNLYLLSLDMTPDLQFLGELQREAQQHGHTQVLQLTELIRLRLLFQLRRWDLVSRCLADFGNSFGYSDLEAGEPSDPWLAYLTMHYLLVRILFEGRNGNDPTVRRLLKKAYSLMDTSMERGTWSELKASGGLIDVKVGETARLRVQATPPNVTFILIYLVTVVARRDYLGTEQSCKALVHPRAMQEFENIARADDMWDLDFSCHGLTDAVQTRSRVNSIRCEAMLEEVTACIFRSDFDTVEKVFTKLINLARASGIFVTLGPQLCLVKAQYAHILGRTTAAERYYRACASLILPGSELSQIVEIGLIGALGSVELDTKRDEIVEIANKCRASTIAGLEMAGYLLSSLVDPNRASSKKQLAHAYELATRAKHEILRCLIFAFTTSTHLYGEEDKTLKQLETGRDLAMLLGGKDREDGVGQMLLGLWFAYKLKEHHRRAGHTQEMMAAKERIATHIRRLEELRERGMMFDKVLPAIGPIMDRTDRVKQL